MTSRFVTIRNHLYRFLGYAFIRAKGCKSVPVALVRAVEKGQA